MRYIINISEQRASLESPEGKILTAISWSGEIPFLKEWLKQECMSSIAKDVAVEMWNVSYGQMLKPIKDR